MNNPRINLQLFAEGGAGAGAAGSGGNAAAAGAGTQADNSPLARGGRRDSRQAVSYGRQAQPQVAPAANQMEAAQANAAAAAQAGQLTGEGAHEDFESLITGRYKADFEKRVQGIVGDRLKTSREREGKVTPILEILGDRYGMDISDMQKLDLDELHKRIAGDTSIYEKEAREKGLDEDVVAKMHRLELMEKRQARQQREAQARRAFEAEQQKIRSHFDSLQRQAEEVKKVYPGFDLNAELKNEAFVDMTKPGSRVDVMTAYRAIHHDELAGAEMQFAAQKSAQRISASVQANGRRPAENGLNGSVGAVNKTDPRSFTHEDFKNIREQLKKGKKIYLD